MLGVVSLGSMAPRVLAQQVKPNVWPPIEVWGVRGKSFGTIAIAQPLMHNILSHGLIAEFIPANHQLLSELAKQLWPGADPTCLHFNWIQIAVNPGNLPLPVDAAGLPLKPPFVDPPIGGYQGDAKGADALPWYLDETAYVAGKTAGMNVHNRDITRATALRWYAKPYSASAPDVMSYDTVLVLINDCTSQYEPLGGFHWQAIFPVNGDQYFRISPFGPKEWFTNGGLVTAFTSSTAQKKTKSWTLRPLVKP